MRKSLSTGGGAGADNLVNINARAAEILFVQPAHMREKLLQRGKIGILMPRRARLHFLEAQSPGLQIRDVCHT